jgi:hypothetical protein
MQPDGFDVFVPPQAVYDASKAAHHIWRGRRRSIVPVMPPYVPLDAERSGWRYPALSWLADCVAKIPSDTRILFVFMPAHVAAQPQPGSPEAAREAEFKARIAGIADQHAAIYVDFKIPSSITTDDRNYWDSLHYRLQLAARIIDDIATAAATRGDDPNGDWLVLAGKRAQERVDTPWPRRRVLTTFERSRSQYACGTKQVRELHQGPNRLLHNAGDELPAGRTAHSRVDRASVGSAAVMSGDGHAARVLLI